MKRITIENIFWSVFTVWLGIQFYLVAEHLHLANHDDALSYELLARRCLDRGCWYPSVHNLYDNYVFAPGYINLLIGVHHLFGTFSAIKFINLLLNIVLLWEVYLLAKRLFDRKVAFTASVLYMLTYSNSYLPIAQLTDLPFTVLSATALLLSQNKRLWSVAAAGVLIALANWMRPLAVVFLLAILVYFVLNKRRWSSYAVLFGGLLLTLVLIGHTTRLRSGYFIFQSTTGGVNLAMSAFDGANGLVNFEGLKDSSSYTYLAPGKSYTYIERDAYLKTGAKRWIMENPLKYVSQLPVKVGALYCEDTWPERVKPGMGFGTLLPKVKKEQAGLLKLGLSVFAKSLMYYVILFFFLYYICISRNDLFAKRNVFLLVPVLGTAMTVAVVVTSRYHYPYLFMITVYAAYGLHLFYRRRQKGAEV